MIYHTHISFCVRMLSIDAHKFHNWFLIKFEFSSLTWNGSRKFLWSLMWSIFLIHLVGIVLTVVIAICMIKSGYSIELTTRERETWRIFLWLIHTRSIIQSRISENNQIFLFTAMSYGHVSLLINALQNKWNQLSFLHVDLVNVFWYPMILCSPQKKHF